MIEFKLKDKDLAELVEKWFNDRQMAMLADKRFWGKNPLAKVIKAKMKQLKRYKNAPRTNGNINNLKSNNDW